MNASSDSKGSEQDLEGCCKDLLEVTQRRRRDFHTPQSWGGCRHGTRSRGGVAARGSTLSSRGLRVSSHHTRLSRPLWTLRLGVRATVVGHSPLSVIDLLRLLVAEEKQDGTEEEDGCPPAHPIRPAKLPQLPIALLNLGCKACWVDHQGDQDAQQCADHYVEGEPIHEVLAHRVLAAQATPRHHCGCYVAEEGDHAQGSGCLDVCCTGKCYACHMAAMTEEHLGACHSFQSFKR